MAVVELSTEKLKEKRAAKKAERTEAKEKKAAEKRTKKLEASPLLKAVDDLNNHRRKLYEQYLAEVQLRGQDLSTWPLAVIAYYKDVAPYEIYGINISGVVEQYTPQILKIEETIDLSKGFKPTIHKEEETVKPFSFNANMEKIPKPKQGPGVTDAMFKKLEKAFSGMLKGQEYRYEYNNGIYNLFITRTGGVEESYIVDTGAILGGNEIHVLASKINDTVFISVKDPEMSSILVSRFYVVSEDCAKRNEAGMFKEGRIYRYIDFSNTEFLDKGVDKDTLEKNLAAIIKILESENGEAPRMRFTSFESETRFSLVSDANTKSPLVSIDATCALILPGLKVELDNGKIKIYNNEILTSQYTISEK